MTGFSLKLTWYSLSALCLLPGSSTALADREPVLALDIASTVESVAAEQELWPGFRPLEIPLAIFDGTDTWLFRHPGPPEGFTVQPLESGAAYRFEGRHPAMTANSSMEIGGVVSATLLAEGAAAQRSVRALAAVALHEAFHVYQRERHPGWAGDEAALFLYPFDDPDVLRLRRLEMEGLRRAITGEHPEACWAAEALALREQRFAQMDPVFRDYERATELNEGLAAYVQARVNRQTAPDFPAKPLQATEVRQRTYITGSAMALLLDRLAPDWKGALESDDTQSLDALLSRALADLGDGASAGCGFTDAEVAAAARLAQRDAGQVGARRQELQQRFEALPGWRILIQAGAEAPLWPHGFDPLNVEWLGSGLLHTRWLRLGNESGQLDVMDSEGVDLTALTRSAGDHPLYNGVVWVMVAGLSAPEVANGNGVVDITANGFSARFEPASVSIEGQQVSVILE